MFIPSQGHDRSETMQAAVKILPPHKNFIIQYISKKPVSAGFTLIELSIVLVIIGLIVGGTLVGQDLIKSAQTQATIAQIQKYDAAVNTFKSKYGYLPGDIPDPYATKFGFTPRGLLAGQGDGNGLIEGYALDVGNCGYRQGTGETAMFWVDLTYANGLKVNMISGGFQTASPATAPGTDITGSNIDNYLPQAKLGAGNYIYVWSSAYITGTCSGGTNNGSNNYFGLSVVTDIQETSGTPGAAISSVGLSVAQAFNIDKKMDDGFPQSGHIIAGYVANNNSAWAGVTPGNSITSSSSTCYDNGGNSANPMQYSTTQNGGNNLNCALSFQMQGAAR